MEQPLKHDRFLRPRNNRAKTWQNGADLSSPASYRQRMLQRTGLVGLGLTSAVKFDRTGIICGNQLRRHKPWTWTLYDHDYCRWELIFLGDFELADRRKAHFRQLDHSLRNRRGEWSHRDNSIKRLYRVACRKSANACFAATNAQKQVWVLIVFKNLGSGVTFMWILFRAGLEARSPKGKWSMQRIQVAEMALTSKKKEHVWHSATFGPFCNTCESRSVLPFRWQLAAKCFHI